MKNKPQLVIEYVEEFISSGWNKAQAQSLAWAEYFELKDAKYEAWRGARDLSMADGTRIDCYCFDCKDGGQLLPSTTIMWLGMHKDHKTKTMKLR